MSQPQRPRSYGTAGKSLGEAETRRKFGAQAEAGASGERYFRSALERAGLGTKYEVYYSLKIPNDPTRADATKYSSDVDVALASGDRLVLVDVKRWAAGKFYWSCFGKPFKGVTPMRHNGEWRLSANMAMAVSRYRKCLPGVRVEGIVVFVPTGLRGERLPAGVGLLRWPGGIRSYVLGPGLDKIKRTLGPSLPVDPRIKGVLGRMVR